MEPSARVSFEEHLSKLMHAKDSIRSMNGIDMDSKFDTEKNRFTKEKVGMWGKMFSNFPAEKKDAIVQIQSSFFVAMNQIQRDITSQVLTREQLMLLDQEIKNLDRAVAEASDGLDSLKSKNADNTADLNKTIDGFVQGAKEAIITAKKILSEKYQTAPPAPPPRSKPSSEATGTEQRPDPVAQSTTPPKPPPRSNLPRNDLGPPPSEAPPAPPQSDIGKPPTPPPRDDT